MKKQQVRASASPLDEDETGVERPGPGKAPTAFRIWRRGLNRTEKGNHIFSETSARLLLEEQAEKGTLYMIDVDHRSLDEDAPFEQRKAVGWHRLEVRNGELWAVSVTWTPWAAAAIENREFRYFSPTYFTADLGATDREVVSYLNTALCNLPASFGIVSLAASRNACPHAEFLRSLDAEMVRFCMARGNAVMASAARRELARRGAAGLTPREIKLCADKKIDPAKYAATRAAIQANSRR